MTKKGMYKRGDTGFQEGVDAILNSIADGVFTVDKNWRITSFNKAAQAITGVSEEEALGSFCSDVFRASICETECSLRKTMETGRSIVNKAIYIINSDGRKIPISISTALLKDRNNRIIGGVETFRDLSMVEQLRKELSGRYNFEDIISKNKQMQQIFEMLPMLAESDSSVLIEGESGVGKELIARALHNLSPHRKEPLITVNCGALPDTLLESELFGYEAGAFTDAKRAKLGRFALAGKGTLFLDEMGDISAALQVKLLRVLQEKKYEPLGAVNSKESHARIIAATNRNLLELVRQGKFRQDLYYRINVVKVKLPPLRHRKEDIPLLVKHFVSKFNKLKGKNITDLSTEAMKILMNYNYPGNIRELENIVEHSFVLLSSGMITTKHLPADLIASQRQSDPSNLDSLEETEKQFINRALERNNFNRVRTAKELGIHKTTLYRKIRRLGIELSAVDGRSSKSESD